MNTGLDQYMDIFKDAVEDSAAKITKADISFNAPLQFNAVLKAGPIYVSDMFNLYKYEIRQTV